MSGEDYRGRKVTESAQCLKKDIKEINKNKDVKFVIFTGDNIDVADKDDKDLSLKGSNDLLNNIFIKEWKGGFPYERNKK